MTAKATNEVGVSKPLVYNATEAAKVLRIGKRLLWTWTNCGKIPHVRIGSRVLYPVATLEAWLAEQSLNQTKQ